MDKLRDFLHGWPGRITMGLIMLPMVFLGVQGMNGGTHIGTNELVKAGDSTIDVSVYQSELNNYRQQLLQNNDASMINERAMADEVLDDLINRVLLQNQTQVLGMSVSDEVISQMIAQDESFWQDGRFSNELFAQFLDYSGLTKDELFARFRTQLSIRQLTASILGTAIYPTSQVGRLLDLQLEAREVWVHRFAWQDYADQVSVSQSQIEAYFNEHKESLIRPESVDLTYIELTMDELKVDAPTEEEIVSQFANYLQKNGLSDGRELSQILLSGSDAKAKANEIRAKLDKGESFEVLAKQYSDDPSGESGGYIGKYNPSVFGNDAGKVNAALAGLKVGGVSQPVQTSFGYQIFKVVKAGSITVDGVRDELVQMALKQKREAAYHELITKINNMANDAMGISDIAATVSLPAKSIKSYPKNNNTTELSQPVVIDTAFDDFNIQDQAVSANITLGDTKTVWVQSTNHQEARPLTLPEATPQIKELLHKKAATELALAAASKLAEQAKVSGVQSLMTSGANFGIATRQSPNLSIQERASLFIHKSGKNDIWSVQTEQGASVIIGGPVSNQAVEQISAVERMQAAMIIRDNIGDDQWSDYLHYLKDNTKVTVNRSVLDR